MINIWAIIVSAVAAMVIGSIWWGPLFGKMWMRENGFHNLSEAERQAMKQGMFWGYVQQFIMSAIEAWVLAWAIAVTGYASTGSAIKLGIILWAGFVLPIQYGAKIWGNKKFNFVLATLASSLLTVIVMAWIISAWQ